MEEVVLNNGVRMPLVGFGTYRITGAECAEAVETAIRCGYRMIDTAEIYQNEAAVGEGIRRSGVPRGEPTIGKPEDPESVRRALFRE